MSIEEIGIVVTAIATAILASITAVYVILTKQLVDQTSKLHTKQLNLMTFPSLFLKGLRTNANNELKLHLINYGNNPAYDIDILAIGVFFDDDFPLEILKRDIIQISPEDNIETFQYDSEGKYGIFHRMGLPTLPGDKQFIELLQFPYEIEYLHVLVQFRNTLGNNYSFISDFFRESSKDFREFVTFDRRDITEVMPRFELDLDQNRSNITGSILNPASHVPQEYIEFNDLMSHSIGTGRIRGMFYGILDERGFVSNISNSAH